MHIFVGKHNLTTLSNPMQQDKNHVLKKEEILSKDIEKRVDIYQDTVDSLLLK